MSGVVPTRFGALSLVTVFLLGLSCAPASHTPVGVPSDPPAASTSTRGNEDGYEDETFPADELSDDEQEKIVFRGHNSFGDVLVTERDAIRCLKFSLDGGEQSCVDLSQPHRIVHEYVRMMLAGPLFVHPGPSALMVGLGGGVGVRELLRSDPRMRMTAVEINPLVVDVAQTYFHLQPSEHLKFVVKDGRAFLRSSGEKWDIIFLDAFGADFIPFELTTRQFVELVRRHLRPDGVVVANLWDRNHQMFRALVKVYLTQFSRVLLIHGEESANVILIASTDPKTACDSPLASSWPEIRSRAQDESMRRILSQCTVADANTYRDARDLSDDHPETYKALGPF